MDGADGARRFWAESFFSASFHLHSQCQHVEAGPLETREHAGQLQFNGDRNVHFRIKQIGSQHKPYFGRAIKQWTTSLTQTHESKATWP